MLSVHVEKDRCRVLGGGLAQGRCRLALDGRVVHRMMVTRAMHQRRCSCRGQDKETRRGRRKAASPQDYRHSWQGVEHAWTRARVENAEHTRTCERHDDASICTYPLKGPGACFTPWLPRASCAPSLALFRVCVCVCVCGGRAKVSGVLMHRGRGVEETGPRETTALRQWCGV